MNSKKNKKQKNASFLAFAVVFFLSFHRLPPLYPLCFQYHKTSPRVALMGSF